MRTCCKFIKSKDPAYVYVVTRAMSGEGDDEDDVDEFSRIKLVIEKKADNLEQLVTKQVVKSIENLGTNTKNRFKNIAETLNFQE